ASHLAPRRLPCRSYRKRGWFSEPISPPELGYLARSLRRGTRGANSRRNTSLILAAVELKTIVVLEGDQTGQELLEEALRVLSPDVIGVELELPRYDLSLGHRRETGNEVVHEAARAIREAGMGLKAATITPAGRGDAG